ncbi:MAG TPA: hypothetical protein VF137_04200 [Candidatus Dormibacteraeota bacterium]
MKLRLLGALGTAAAGLFVAHPQAAPPPAPTTTPVAATSASTNTSADCDAGAWHTGDISVQGRPDNFQPTATYIWHDAGGWHLRTSGANDKPHVFSGRVTLRGGTFTNVEKVRDERDDHLEVDGNTIYYRFVTFAAVDGFDFRVSGCSNAEQERLVFGDRYDGAADAGKVDVGDHGRHPDSDPFVVVRSL